MCYQVYTLCPNAHCHMLLDVAIRACLPAACVNCMCNFTDVPPTIVYAEIVKPEQRKEPQELGRAQEDGAGKLKDKSPQRSPGKFQKSYVQAKKSVGKQRKGDNDNRGGNHGFQPLIRGGKGSNSSCYICGNDLPTTPSSDLLLKHRPMSGHAGLDAPSPRPAPKGEPRNPLKKAYQAARGPQLKAVARPNERERASDEVRPAPRRHDSQDRPKPGEAESPRLEPKPKRPLREPAQAVQTLQPKAAAKLREHRNISDKARPAPKRQYSHRGEKPRVHWNSQPEPEPKHLVKPDVLPPIEARAKAKSAFAQPKHDLADRRSVAFADENGGSPHWEAAKHHLGKAVHEYVKGGTPEARTPPRAASKDHAKKAIEECVKDVAPGLAPVVKVLMEMYLK